MRQKDHERVIKELADRHRETVRALEQRQADRTLLHGAPPMAAETARLLANVAVKEGHAAHAVYLLGDETVFLLFADHETFDAWVRAESAGRRVGAFHGSDIR